MLKDLYLGCDVGAKGAFAVVSDKGLVDFARFDKLTSREIFNWLDAHSKRINNCVVEKVHSSPQMGVRSAFSFGQSNGMALGLLIGVGLRYETVTPRQWQTRLKCTTKGDKNITKAMAHQLFPLYAKQICHANADAILIAEYCRLITQERRA